MDINELLNLQFSGYSMQDLLDFYNQCNEKFQAAATTVSDIITSIQNIRDIASSDISSVKAATALLLGIVQKKRAGLSMSEYTQADWQDVIKTVETDVFTADPRQYTQTVFSWYLRAMNSTMDSLSAVVSEKTIAGIQEKRDELDALMQSFQAEEIDEVKFIEEAEMTCMEGILRILSAYITSSLAEEFQDFGASLATLVFEVGRYKLYAEENRLLTEYLDHQNELTAELEKQFQEYLSAWKENIEKISALIQKAFDSDSAVSFEGSGELAEILGVDTADILKSTEDIDAFFM